MTGDVRGFWDEQAACFDEEPDHGLRDPVVRAAWAELLLRVMPPAPADVTDLGCGTGSLSVLLARAGHRVRGLDVSDRMVAAAAAKARAAGAAAEFVQGDSAAPPYEPESTDAVLARLVLIEGRWPTGAGITSSACRALVLEHRDEALVERLDDPALWGRPIEDERYVVLSQ